jgi:hypothetical protein
MTIAAHGNVPSGNLGGGGGAANAWDWRWQRARW